MTQFLKAKFLSEALEWKNRHPTDLFFAGLRYEPFIFQQARLTFRSYNSRYPVPDNHGFTENFVKDLNNKSQELLKIISPEMLTPELEIANKQFETEADIEQQQVAQMNNQPAPAPFSLTSPTAPSIPKMPVSMSSVGAGAVNAPIAETTAPETAAQTPTDVSNLPQTPLTGTPAAAIPTKAVSEVRQAESAAAPSSGKILSAFGSKAGQRIGGAIKSGLETANPYLGRAGNRLIGGLTNIVSPGGGGVGTRSIFGRFNRGGGNGGFLRGIGRGGGGGESLVGKAKARGGLVFALSIIGFMVLVGGLAAFAPNATTGQAAPPPTYQPGTGAGVVGCPFNGTPVITNGSKGTGGHCSQSYEQNYGVCVQPGQPNYTGKETAIDVTSSDQLVYLPKLKGADTQWTIDEAGNIPITAAEGGGISVAAYTTDTSGTTYRIRFVHINSTSLRIGDQVNSGTLIGQYYPNNPFGAHAHITITENDIFKPVDLYFKLCQ